MAAPRSSLSSSEASHEVASFTGSDVNPQALQGDRQSFLQKVSSTASNLLSSTRARTHSVTSAVAGLENFGYNGELYGVTLEPEEADEDEELQVATKSEASSGSQEGVEPGVEGLDEKLAVDEGVSTKKDRFWSSNLHETRTVIYRTLLTNYVFLILGFAICLCIYWGSFFGRAGRLKNLHYLVVDGDGEVEKLPPVLGTVVTKFFSSPKLAPYGTFKVLNYTESVQMASAANMTLEQYAQHQVYVQKYSAAYFVRNNATAIMYRMLATANSSFSPSRELLAVYYETGSDYNKVANYVIPVTQLIALQFGEIMRTVKWNQFWFTVLNSTQISQVMNNAPSLFTSLPSFKLVDNLPVKKAVYQAPLQIGLIYLCVFTFFQFVFTYPVQLELASKLTPARFVAVRMFLAQGAYFLLSLAYIVLNTAFQMNFTATFGYLGFLVIWMFAFLTMSSIGSIMEALVLVCFIFKPACIGLVILFVAVTNLAPTISPIPLCPTFYRYGYAMPVFNSYHLMNIAYFNSWKGDMGRYIGILVAWSVVSNLCMPFVMMYASKVMKKRKAAAATIPVGATVAGASG
ncbi:hypothetical protein PUMCH_001421 [Australozyma saopauloensis]|uniref:DUF3533 domain-containing protein n=1 Tax=Australozyma saopauloensis TaxID=291208 RepID=A0AAX4H7D3_9ASCO|nr:hypothetical protein PUMCH_001421 [[Candida] saopauloensis]